MTEQEAIAWMWVAVPIGAASGAVLQPMFGWVAWVFAVAQAVLT